MVFLLQGHIAGGMGDVVLVLSCDDSQSDSMRLWWSWDSLDERVHNEAESCIQKHTHIHVYIYSRLIKISLYHGLA